MVIHPAIGILKKWVSKSVSMVGWRSPSMGNPRFDPEPWWTAARVLGQSHLAFGKTRLECCDTGRVQPERRWDKIIWNMYRISGWNWEKMHWTYAWNINIELWKRKKRHGAMAAMAAMGMFDVWFLIFGNSVQTVWPRVMDIAEWKTGWNSLLLGPGTREQC